MNKHYIRIRILYTICFILLCAINWIVGSMPGRIQFIAVNCTGLVIAAIILSNYRIKDFFKPAYYVWTAVCLIGAPYIIIWAYDNCEYFGKWFSATVNVIIYGYILIRTIYYFKELKKQNFKIVSNSLDKKNSLFTLIVFAVFVVMMILMIISRQQSIWPLCFLLMFLPLYILDLREKKTLLIYGAADGIIISFFVLQVLALLFRPYDTPRYTGFFANCNINGLFYLYALCAAIIKILIIQDSNNARFQLKKLLHFLLLGFILSLTLLTGSRTILVTDCLVFFVSLVVFLYKRKKKSILVKFLAVTVFSVVIMAPLTYCAVRYIPTIHLHPIYFEGEYDEQRKVLPGESRDSEKYVGVSEVLYKNFGRVFWFLKSDKSEDMNSDLENDYENEFVEDKKVERVSPITIRTTIYKWYLKNLNLIGHTSEEEVGVPVGEKYVAPHAHNVFLQMSYWFGIPAGVLFACLIILSYFGFFRLLKSKNYLFACSIGCFTTAFVSFGMFEVDWHVGQLSFTMFFLMLYYVINSIDYSRSSKSEKSVFNLSD